MNRNIEFFRNQSEPICVIQRYYSGAFFSASASVRDHIKKVLEHIHIIWGIKPFFTTSLLLST